MSEDKFDIIVIGAGHAGCEAALAAARMGARTLLMSMYLFTTAQMSCNPAIGGLAKGHLVKEIDALGGEMGVVADETGIQFRMLNKSKGPAVWSPRSQNDRLQYSFKMRETLANQQNLLIQQHNIIGLQISDKKVVGVITEIGAKICARAVIICSGTFLNGLIHVGLNSYAGGRSGEPASIGLSSCLIQQGFRVGRLKTGTPPRLDGKNIDFDKMQIQPGDENPVPFSHKHERILTEQLPCYLTKTTEKTHEILRAGLDRSPLFTGVIRGIGPRYCPSIEDKIFRFSDKKSHQIFLEPEGRKMQEYYLNGFSTSLPEDVQVKAVHSIPGLEKVWLTRVGYAIEYDYFPPSQLQTTLESKIIENLYFAGQINGTSGYEEAAAQGLVAGINAVLKMRDEAPFVLSRSEAYIGVLIDDLVTKDLDEPYRMFTSLAEYRLLLRQDNADFRLMEYGFDFGLIPKSAYEEMRARKIKVKETIEHLHHLKLDLADVNRILERIGSSPLKYNEPVAKILKRPEISLRDFAGISSDELFDNHDSSFWQRIREQVEIEIKYEGFLSRQLQQVERMRELDDMRIPNDFDYGRILSLSIESREKLDRIKPHTLGQASRIMGVSPSDVAVIMVYLNRFGKRKAQNVSRET